MRDDFAAMSNLTLEQFRDGYLNNSLPAFNRGDFAVAFARLAPDCEFYPFEEISGEGVLVGPEQVCRFFEELFETFPDWRVESVRVLQAPDGTIVTLERGRGSGRTSEVSGVLEFANTLELRGSMVVCVRQYASWEQGLLAAGLDPSIAADARGPERPDD
jgi:hypothetical protein